MFSWIAHWRWQHVLGGIVTAGSAIVTVLNAFPGGEHVGAIVTAVAGLASLFIKPNPATYSPLPIAPVSAAGSSS